MSELPSETPKPVTFEDVCDNIKDQLSFVDAELGKIFDDDSHDMSVQMVAAQAANGLQAVVMLVSVVEALYNGLVNGISKGVAQVDTKWEGKIEPLLARLDLADASRAEMRERIEQLEYAGVAEAQAERIKEQLVGDLADLMADRLRGENDS